VICGASGGVGPAVLDALEGLSDVMVGVASPRSDPAVLEAIHPGVSWERADLTDAAAVAGLWRAIDARGEVRRLVNLTGGYAAGTLVESPPEQLRELLAVNLETAWWSCREAARRMVGAGGGAIVNVSAQAALKLGPGAAAYAVSKAALVALGQVLAAELRGSGVRVNTVAPGAIDTPGNRTWMSPRELARAVSPAQVAAVIAALCDERTGAVSGAVLPIGAGV